MAETATYGTVFRKMSVRIQDAAFQNIASSLMVLDIVFVDDGQRTGDGIDANDMEHGLGTMLQVVGHVKRNAVPFDVRKIVFVSHENGEHDVLILLDQRDHSFSIRENSFVRIDKMMPEHQGGKSFFQPLACPVELILPEGWVVVGVVIHGEVCCV